MTASLVNLPKRTKVPNHISIILDGNRRWARSRGLPTLQGHKKGFENVVNLCRAAREWGIHTVTLWGWSTENWDRSEEEVNYLMRLFNKMIDIYFKEAMENEVRIYHLGRKDRLPKQLVKKIAEVEEKTKSNKKYILNIALDYGGQDEILRAVKKVMESGISSSDINQKTFENYLDTAHQPYPYVDLFIRTGGEQRTSGFLLWQAHYAEYYFEHCHLPDFSVEKLREAILDYSRRRRRFGGNDAIEHFSFKPELAAKLEVKWWRLRKIPHGVSFTDYTINHLKEQYGLSKELAGKAAKYMLEALSEGDKSKWEKAGRSLSRFYKLIQEELKIAFEPKLVASLEVKLWKELKDKDSIEKIGNAQFTAQELYAESYRLSLFQAAKLAHLRVLANIEKNLAEKGMGDHHWQLAEDYLNKFYIALKDRVA